MSPLFSLFPSIWNTKKRVEGRRDNPMEVKLTGTQVEWLPHDSLSLHGPSLEKRRRVDETTKTEWSNRPPSAAIAIHEG